MKNTTAQKIAAVTLIEVIVYLALFAIIFVTIVQISLAIAENNRNARETNALERSILFVHQHLTEGTRSASSIDQSNSVFNNDSGRLQLEQPDGQYEVYYVQNGILMHSVEGDADLPVTNPGFTVTSFNIVPIEDDNNVPVGIRGYITIRSDENTQLSRSIETSYTLQ